MYCMISMVIAQNKDLTSKQTKEQHITIVKKDTSDQKKLKIVIEGNRLTINGQPLKEMGLYNPEDTVTITYLRKRNVNIITVALDKKKKEENLFLQEDEDLRNYPRLYNIGLEPN